MRTLMIVCMIPGILLFGGCSKSNPANSVSGNFDAPVISLQPQSQTVIVGQSVTFTVTDTGNPAPTYQWRKYGTNISDTSSSYTISSVQITDAGMYSVVVSNRYGSDTSNGAWLTVYPVVTPSGMINIPGGTFQMGQPNPNLGDSGWTSDEQPVHNVTISTFYMDKTDVTQADYRSLMGVNPSRFIGDSLRPVEWVTWFDAVLYCNARSKRDLRDTVYTFTSITGTPGNGCLNLGGLANDFTKNGYRLPTEAEWEYACRAGTTTDFYWGKNYPPTTTADTTAIDNNAIWWHNSNDSTARVGTKLPNAWGLYDMIGNVWEWCNDWYNSNYYSVSPSTDPTGPSTGSSRVSRGGSWDNHGVGWFLRSANRIYSNPVGRGNGDGFRCVRR